MCVTNEMQNILFIRTISWKCKCGYDEVLVLAEDPQGVLHLTLHSSVLQTYKAVIKKNVTTL